MGTYVTMFQKMSVIMNAVRCHWSIENRLFGIKLEYNQGMHITSIIKRKNLPLTNYEKCNAMLNVQCNNRKLIIMSLIVCTKYK